MTPNFEFVVLRNRAKMPARCWGRYANVGLVRYSREKGCCYQIRDTKSQKVIWAAHGLFDGTSNRCAASKAEATARDIMRLYQLRQYMARLATMGGYIAEDSALLDTDLVAVRKRGSGVVIRYDASWQRVGVSVRLPADLDPRRQWEHGSTLAECRAEIAHKRKIAIDQREKERIAALDAERRAHIDRVVDRVARLAKIDVTWQDARRAGMCAQGIMAYCVRHRLDTTETARISAEIIRGIGDPRAYPAILAAAKRIVSARENTR